MAKIKFVTKVKFVNFPHIKIFVLVSALILPLILNMTNIPTHEAIASTDAVKWTKVNIPTEGKAGDWVLADGSDVQHLSIASDGTLYAYGKGLAYTLYRSANGGSSWSNIGNVQDAIVGIATSPNDASNIYYATTSAVYRSTDDGQTFHALPEVPGGAGSNNVEITSIDVTWLDNNIIAVGTRDADSTEFGGVYTLDEEYLVPDWTDTNLGSYDVYAVAFSPNYPADGQLVAVVTDETDTLVMTRICDAAWGASIGNAILDRDNSGTPTSVAVAASAAIAFPSDYDSDAASGSCVQFIAINTGSGDGDVYKISGAEAPSSSVATDLNAGADHGLSNTDITGLSACGDAPACLLAGAADSAQTYFSADGGRSWQVSRKEPTGESQTYVLIAPDFSDTGKVYTATSGDESALSISHDNGDTWNQISLIDTDISTIVDLAPSPRYSQDNTLFMLTSGGGNSLWRSLDGGNTWARTLASALADVDSISMVDMPPQYGDNCQTLFIAGESDGRPIVWKSTDNAQKFRRRFARDPTTGAPIPIDAWAIVDDNTMFISSYNGSNGLVYHTTDSGLNYSEGSPVGSQSLNSIALSPDYEQNETILVGNTNGWIYWSDDNGASFKPLPTDAASPPLSNFITVAFDSNFDSNKTVYAASDTAGEGVYRFIIGTSADWESTDSTLPDDALLNQLIVASDDILYAANSRADGGMERCLNPSYSLGPTFETVTRGLGDGATLSGLWQSDHRLWSTDTTNIRLMTFNDTLSSPVTLTSPDNTASGSGSLIDHTVRNVSLDWETMEGTTSYQWQLDYDTDLSSVPNGFEDNTEASYVRLPTLESATTYYWRVRAKAPVLSPWSDKWSFTTSLDTEVISLSLESPEAGASGVPVKPVFQWTAVAGADAYELMVSTNADFTSPSIVKKDDYALSATAWQCDVSLDHDTTYYWKVRAISNSTQSAWSASGAFTTEPPPTPVTSESPVKPASSPAALSPEPVPATTNPLPNSPAPMPMIPPFPTSSSSKTTTSEPTTLQPPDIPNWVVYLIGALLVTIILTLIIILTLVVAIRRR